MWREEAHLAMPVVWSLKTFWFGVSVLLGFRIEGLGIWGVRSLSLGTGSRKPTLASAVFRMHEGFTVEMTALRLLHNRTN